MKSMKLIDEIKLVYGYSIKSKKRPGVNFHNRSINNPSKDDEDKISYDSRNQISNERYKLINGYKDNPSICISIEVTNRYKTKNKKLIGLPKITTPDCDNFLKLICDSLNGLMWNDDRIIYEMISRKLYDIEDIS